MKVRAEIVRSAGDRRIAEGLLTPIRTRRGRPRAQYRAVVRTEEDAERLRRRGLPLCLITSDWVTESGYPTQFRSWLAVPETISELVDSTFRLLPVRDPATVEEPGLPELVTFLLRFDPLAARAVALRNRERLDLHELYRRVRNEQLERAATRVRLQELCPAIPAVGEALPAEDLSWVDENNPALTRSG